MENGVIMVMPPPVRIPGTPLPGLIPGIFPGPRRNPTRPHEPRPRPGGPQGPTFPGDPPPDEPPVRRGVR